jgi:biotin transport system substrate-specific component
VSTTDVARRSIVPADLVPWAWVRDVGLTGTFTLAVAVSAQVGVALPGTPVPVTAQTFVVLLGAAALGPVRAGVGAAGFFTLGALGMPWFAVSSGTTLGYVAGFVLACLVVGQLARAGWTRTYSGAAAAMLVGNLAIYAVGATVLAMILGVGPRDAATLGVVPFLLGDGVKLLAATALLPAVQRRVER